VLLLKRFTLPEGWIIELSRIAELGISQRGPIGVCLYQRGCPGSPTRTSLQLGIRWERGIVKGDIEELSCLVGRIVPVWF